MSASATSTTSPAPHRLRARRIGIDTQHEAVVFMHKECSVCRSEGFTAHTRILLRAHDRRVIATLYQTTSDLVAHDEAALSESAWARLGLQDGEVITISHPDPVESMSHVRSRIYGQELGDAALRSIIEDVVDGKYSDIHLSSFITACATRPLHGHEILALTRAMVAAAKTISSQRHGPRSLRTCVTSASTGPLWTCGSASSSGLGAGPAWALPASRPGCMTGDLGWRGNRSQKSEVREIRSEKAVAIGYARTVPIADF